jgi:endonuclease/exonuclease/phosphatase family metal-dependent hydrolase
MRLRLLTYNIHKGFSTGNVNFVLNQIKSSLRETKATLVCLQEVIGSHQLHAKKIKNWPRSSQFEFLAEEHWDHFVYGKNAVHQHGHHGNAILSKFPIISHENEDASLSKLEQRGFLHAVIDVPDIGPVHLISLHLNLFEKDRIKQLKQLCKRVKREVPQHEALLIAGDFNDWRINATEILNDELGVLEAFKEITGKHAQTFPSFFPLFSLDRIYFRGLQCHLAERMHSPVLSSLSDHLPIVAEFSKLK